MAFKEIFDSVDPKVLKMKTALLLLFLILITFWLIKNRLKHNLHSIPGPFLNSITVLPRLWSVYKGRSQFDDLEIHKKYGKIVRLAPNVISISDPAHLDVVYAISSKFFKAGFFEPVRFYDEEGLIPDPFVLADKSMHTRMKRNAANAYSLQALVQLEPLVDEVVDRLFKRLDGEYVATGKSCDIGQYMLFFAMDAIFTVTFGKNLDFIGKGDTKGLCKNLQDGLPYIASVGQIPWAHRFLLGNSYVAKFFESGGESLMTEIMKIVGSQREAAEKEIGDDDDLTAPCTFLMRLLRNQAKSPASITDREINSHSFGNIIAGGDTTSTAVRAILYYLIRHPQATERLVRELREAELDRQGLVVSYNSAAKLPYLSAVIREAMRLHPSVGMILARGVPEGGVTLTGEAGNKYFIDTDAEIGINPWIVHRDPELFPDPEAFKPERWLLAEPDHLVRMNRAWIAFGAGRHSCSGQHISMLEITKLIPSLILRYNMRWEEGAPDISVTNYFFTVQSGLRIRIDERKNETSMENGVGLISVKLQ